MKKKGQVAGAYSDQYFKQRPEKTDETKSAPYGNWYAERVLGKAETEPGPASTEAGDDSQGPQYRDVSGNPEAPSPDHEPSHPHRSPARLEPQGPCLGLSRKTERWLGFNSRELGIIEGNLTASGEDVRRIWFTSCFDGEGKTTAALHAAYALAQGGVKRVLLVDGNPGNPSLEELFSARSAPGLREVLAGEAAVEAALHPTRYKGLDVVPGGTGWETFGYSVPVASMEIFLNVVDRAYDYVVVDGSSIFTSSDTTRAGTLCNGAVLVVGCEQTKWEVVQGAEDKVRNAGVTVLGVALNRRKFYIPRKIYQWLSG